MKYPQEHYCVALLQQIIVMYAETSHPFTWTVWSRWNRLANFIPCGNWKRTAATSDAGEGSSGSDSFFRRKDDSLSVAQNKYIKREDEKMICHGNLVEEFLLFVYTSMSPLSRPFDSCPRFWCSFLILKHLNFLLSYLVLRFSTIWWNSLLPFSPFIYSSQSVVRWELTTLPLRPFNSILLLLFNIPGQFIREFYSLVFSVSFPFLLCCSNTLRLFLRKLVHGRGKSCR